MPGAGLLRYNTPKTLGSEDINTMGGVRKADHNQQSQSAAISIAISLSSGLGVPQFPGGAMAQAYAGPNGAFAQAGAVPGGFGFPGAFPGNGAGAFAGPGGFGSFSPCGCNQNFGAMANNFGGPGAAQNPFQAGFQQGMIAAKMKKLMRKMHRLMAQMNQMGGGFGGPGGLAFGGPGSFGGFPGGFPGVGGFGPRLF